MAIPEPLCNDGPNDLLRKILLGLAELEIGGGGNPVEVDDEGIPITFAVSSLDFTGAGITATAVGNDVTINVDADVVGPAVAVDNDIALFDGATGKLIKDSGVLISSVVTNTTLQSGSQAIGSGVDTISVVFGTVFASPPVVISTISRPSAEGIILVNIDEASITVAGFTASLTGLTGSANYRLKWMAK